MKHTTNLNLALYEASDKMNVTSDTNSLNANTKIIDTEIGAIKEDLKDYDERIKALEHGGGTSAQVDALARLVGGVS